MAFKTVCIVKPDGLEHAQEIKEHLSRVGVTIVEEWSERLEINDVRFLYPGLEEERPDAFGRACKSMTSEDVIVMICESQNGDGCLILKQAKIFLRRAYMKDNGKGVIHTPDTPDEAGREIKYFSKHKERSH